MVVHFQSWEAANLFASDRRSHGYFAEVCDGQSGLLLGPLSIGGFRVITSDSQLPDDSANAGGGPAIMPMQPGLITSLLSRLAALLFWIAVAIVTAVLLIKIYTAFSAQLVGIPGAILTFGLPFLAFVTALALLADWCRTAPASGVKKFLTPLLQILAIAMVIIIALALAISSPL